MTRVELHFAGEWARRAPAADLQEELKKRVGVREGQLLSLREVSRSIERLYESGRLADVVARVEDVPGGVRLSFELTPKQRIARVAVEGNRVLPDEEVAAAAKLEPGKEIFPERLGQAVEAALAHYRRKGYDQAKISSELNELQEGLEVVLTVEEGPPTRLAGLSLAGSPGLPLKKLREVLAVELGEVLDLEALDAKLERLRALYRAERYYGAVISPPVVTRGPQGALVALPLSAGPRYDFHFHGSRTMPDTLLTAALGYDPTEPLDGPLVAQMSRRLESLYRYRGFHDARVRAREVTSPGRERAILVFEIDEGLPLAVDRIDFEGNHAVPTAELRQILFDALAATEPVVTPPILLTDDPLELEGRERGEPLVAYRQELSTVLVEEVYRKAAEAMTAYHHERGFLKALVVVQAIEIDVAARRAQVRFKVDEGVQTRIQEVRTAGLPSSLGVKPPDKPKAGDPLSYAAVDQARAALLRGLASKGHLFARVDQHVTVSEDERLARVSFDVDPGPRVHVGQVLLRGLTRSKEALVRWNLKLKEGDVLDPEMLFESQRNLASLEIFRQATLQLSRPDVVESTKDIEVELREQLRFGADFAWGYSLAEGPRVDFTPTFYNLWGLGVNLALRAKANLFYAATIRPAYTPSSDRTVGEFLLDELGWQVNGSLSERLGPFTLRSDVVFENVARPAYRFFRLALVQGFDVPIYSRPANVFGLGRGKLEWSISPQLELERDNITLRNPDARIDAIDQQRLRFPEGTFTLISPRVQLTLDYRDDPLNPHAGFILSVSPEIIWDLGNQHVNLFRVSSGGSLFVPLDVLYSNMVLAVSLRGGRIFRLGADAVSIGPKRFFLGGATTLRGFREDGLLPEDRRAVIQRDVTSCRQLAFPNGCSNEANQLEKNQQILSEGGEAFVLGRVELRLPLVGALGLSVFAEAGNLWLDTRTVDLRTLRTVAGMGLRYLTPVGPLSLDVGWNIRPDQLLGEPSLNPNFSIGGAF